MRQLSKFSVALVCVASMAGQSGCKNSPKRAETKTKVVVAAVPTAEVIPPLADTPWKPMPSGLWLPVAEDEVEQLKHSRNKILLGERPIYRDVTGRQRSLILSSSGPIHIKIESIEESDVIGVLASLTANKLGLSFGTARMDFPRGMGNISYAQPETPDTNLAGLAELAELRMLDLSAATNIDDSDLVHLAGLGNLRALDISYSGVSDEGAIALSKLSSLQALSLSYTMLTDSALDSVEELRGLRYLNLRGTQITSAGMAKVAKLTALEHLDLGMLPIDDAGLALIAKLPSLRTLSLAGNTKFTAKGIKLIATMGLSELDLSSTWEWRHLPKGDTQVTDEVLAEVAKLKTLESLVLGDVKTFTDLGLGHLASLPTLQSLDLSRSRLTNLGVAAIAAIENLRSLKMSRPNHGPYYDSKPDGTSLEHLAQLKSLRSLDLSGMQIADADMKHLGKLSTLESLTIRENKTLTGVGLGHLSKLTELHLLNLSSCENLTKEGFRELLGLSSLRTLDLSHTEITNRQLLKLAALKGLTKLSIVRTGNITEHGIDKLEQALPNLDVED